MVLQRIVKAKNQRVKRALEKREPKLVENDKQALFLRGGQTSEIVTKALKDLYMLKKPNAVMFQKKNIMRPFEDQTSIEFFSNKNDASLFLFGSHNKKRPHNLVLGRLYDFHTLDMIELGIEKYTPMSDFQTSKCNVGTKPCLLFAGDHFDQDHEFKRLKNMFIDFFRGPVVSNVRLSGLEHVISFTASEGKVFLRSYKIVLKKSGSRTPRVELEEMGPSLDLVVRRTKLASEDLYKQARKLPIKAKPRKKKNVTMDVFGSKKGRIHMQKQDMAKLQTRKMKGLKRGSGAESGAETEDQEPTSKKGRQVEGESE